MQQHQLACETWIHSSSNTVSTCYVEEVRGAVYRNILISRQLVVGLGEEQVQQPRSLDKGSKAA